MGKELEVFELNRDVLCKLSELNKDKVYVFNIEVGDMTKGQVGTFLAEVKQVVEKTGVVGIYVPTHNGIGAWDIKELSKYITKDEKYLVAGEDLKTSVGTCTVKMNPDGTPDLSDSVNAGPCIVQKTVPDAQEKTDMFRKSSYTPYVDFNYEHFCSKCNRYEKCHGMNPECEHSNVTYCQGKIMIKETEHFILDDREVKDVFNVKSYTSTEDGLTIKIKNADGTTTDLLYVLPNKTAKFMEDPGTYLITNGTMLQDSITSYDLYIELIKIIDEASWQIGFANIQKDFDKYLD